MLYEIDNETIDFLCEHKLTLNQFAICLLIHKKDTATMIRINTEIGKIGAAVNRLTTKESNLTTAITNTQAAKSRIYDADVAKEQIQASKLQILQQTATTQLAQANAAPQQFLALFK